MFERKIELMQKLELDLKPITESFSEMEKGKFYDILIESLILEISLIDGAVPAMRQLIKELDQE